MMIGNSYSRNANGEGRRSRGGSRNGGSPSSSSTTFLRGSVHDDGSGALGLLPPLSPIDGNRTTNGRDQQYHRHHHGHQSSLGVGKSNHDGDRRGYYCYYESLESSGGPFDAEGEVLVGGGGGALVGGAGGFAPGGSSGLECHDYENDQEEQQSRKYYSHQQYSHQEGHEEEGDHLDGSDDGPPRRRLQLLLEGDELNNGNNGNNGKFEIDLSPRSKTSSSNNGNDGKAAAADELGLPTTSPHHHHHHHHQHRQQTFFYSSSSSSSSSRSNEVTSTLTNSSALSSLTSFQSSSFSDGRVDSCGTTCTAQGTIFRSAKKRRYDEYDSNNSNDDDRYDADHGTSTAITPPVGPVPSPSSYPPNDHRFWSYSVGKYAHRRSCYEGFGHSWPLTDRDRAVWTRRDFAFSSKVLGSGNFGEVRLVRSRADSGADSGSGSSSSSSSNNGSRGTVFAIKTISKDKILKSRQGISIARREIEIQTRLHHPNILGCEGYFHDRSSLFLVLEYANGRDLFALFKKKQRMLADDRRRRQVDAHSDDDDDDGDGDDDQYVATLPHSLAARIIRQVAQALLYLESKNVAHRDIKPENIMLHYPSGSRDDPMNAQIKLCDLGWSCWCPSPSGNRHFTLCGTPEYIAPEILASCLPRRTRLSTMVGNAGPFSNSVSMGYDARYVDAWSLGVMIFELISNQTPFGFPASRDDKDDNNNQTFGAIQRFDDDDLESLHVGRDVPHEWRLFGRIVRGLLRTNPMERLSMKQVLDHPWLRLE